MKTLAGFLILCTQAWMVEAASPRAARPNIVFILVDDLAWSDLGCYGHPYHRTPHIDRLAERGLRFTAAYAAAPICSASRASLLTGHTTARLGFEFVTKGADGSQQIDTDVPLRTPPFTLNLSLAEHTLAEHLSQAGYNTGFFGKWHLNQHYQGKYLAWHPQFGPRSQGFKTAEEDFGSHPYSWRGRPQLPALPAGQFPPDSMIDRACDFIKKQSRTDRPYFLMLSTFYVHTPVKTNARWLVESYEDQLPAGTKNYRKRVAYAAFVELLDQQVGRVLQELGNSTEADNTLVLFTSDNGGHPEFASNAPLRGSKWNLYEGGIRVPLIASWPQRIQAGGECSLPVIGYDFLPTLASVAQASKPRCDGIDFSAVFSQEDALQTTRPLLWHFPYYHPETTYSKAIESIGVDDFAVSKTKPQSAMRYGNYKLIHFAEDNRDELYDLSSDIAEAYDLSKQKPELRLQLRSRLEEQLNAMDARRATPKTRPTE